MALVTEVVNYTDHDLIVMEGIEGVYRRFTKTLKFSFGESALTIRGMTNVDCDYLIILTARDQAGEFYKMVHVTPSTISESDRITVVTESTDVDNPVFSKVSNDRRSFKLSARRNLRGIPEPLILNTLQEMEMNLPLYDFSLSANANIHGQEIGSLFWLKNGNTKEFTLSSAANTALEMWESKEKVFRLRIESSLTQIKEQYTFVFQWVIAFYAVFHGVLLSIVANSSALFVCKKIYSAYILSAIISTIAIVVVLWQLIKVGERQEIIDECRSRLSV
ncbi:hypothetical protein KC19_7G143800 [Ceratodon purpureus]|uniref:Uncharacterized protein n=1 Tax=Ceratodon purpureus TaxID=3225 RepID=A0A8T0HB45_CERPU|nr:hypothetical protein KC19_7G143800 [Ceratodon purpureus]